VVSSLGNGDFVAIDANGNTTQKTKNDVTTIFLYDIRDQLGEVQQGTSILGRYGYDYQGRRILKIGDDGRRQYTYDQLSVTTEADPASATVSKYDYGMDQLVRLDNRNEGRSFFHLDILRSTVSLTENGGSTRQSIFYDAWGNERDRVGASANKFTYTGHEKDGETGLIYAKARFYDPDTGRFLSQDTYVGTVDDPPSLHRYFYALENPTRLIDLDGRQAILADDEYFRKQWLDSRSPEERHEELESEAIGLSNAAARSLGSIWASTKNAGRVLYGIWEDTSKLIHYWSRGRGDIILEGAEDRLEGVVEFVETTPERNKRALDLAEERILLGDHFGAGDVYTDEFVAPTATLALTVIEGTARVTSFTRAKLSPVKLAGDLPEVTASTKNSIADLVPLEEKVLTTNTGKELSLGEYARLRRQTPNTAMRKLVNPEGPKVDPVYRYPVDRLEADHIVSMKEITQMPGFAELSPVAQREVLNLRENMLGLGKPTNASKGAHTWESWAGHSRLGPVPPEVRAQMLETEAAARAALERAIQERQGR
jgi:RHS repeat-associated protein